MAFVGDDLPDLKLMKKVHMAIVVADACTEVKEIADWVTGAVGGDGAVREISEAILMAQGIWETSIRKFLN